MKSRSIIFIAFFVFVLQIFINAAETPSQSIGLRTWSADWQANDRYLKLDRDMLYSIVYTLSVNPWVINLVGTTGNFKGENSTNRGTFTDIKRSRNEFEGYGLYTYEIGKGSIGVGAGYRYIRFKEDFDILTSKSTITLHGPIGAVSYSQPLDKNNTFLFSASGTLMPYLFVKDDLSGPWTLGRVYFANGVNETSNTWGWNGQFAFSYLPIENWIITLGYKYQDIKRKVLDYTTLEEEKFKGLFAEVKFNW
jgi:hypothetical protein